MDENLSFGIKVGSVIYTPSSFLTGSCLGAQVIFARGELANEGLDGFLRSRAFIGAFPACQAVHSLHVVP
jgi:hypothetical protein